MAKKSQKNPEEAAASITPLMSSASDGSETRTRRNAASTIERTDKFKNIEDGLVPFKYSSGGTYQNRSSIDIRDAVRLCQKAYYNFAVFRNTIDLMTEFSVSPIYFKGGSKKSRDFFTAFFRKINLWSFQDKFFREFYRSGNVFVYRFDAKLKTEDLKKITQTFGAAPEISNTSEAGSVSIPSKYIILNPADIQLTGSLSFYCGRYSKIVSDYELQRLRTPQSEEEAELVQGLDEETRKKLKLKNINHLLIPLSPDKITAVFYKKQDYEPFAVPMGYPVLEDLNAKSEMKKIDMAIARTMQQAVLLITMGTEPEKGGINQRNLEAMQKLFENQSVGRVLISDYTTKAEFVIPQIGDLLDPKKYEVLDKDIRIGLNNILISENEKFSNQSIKVKVFMERLKEARESFISEFLFPEMKRICKKLGFKNYPTPYFEDVDMRDGVQYSKIYNRLVELGVLTPEEGIHAMRSGVLPEPDESLDSQVKFKELKERGLYEPIIGGKKDPLSSPAGRPEGSTGIPQSTKNINASEREVKATVQEDLFVFSKVKENLIAAQNLVNEVEKITKEKHNLKKLNKTQKEVCAQITELVMANEPIENWITSAAIYAEKPEDKNKEMVAKIQEISAKHQVDNYLACVLYASRKTT